MKKSIKVFEGEKDFRAFVTENKDKENCIRTIYKTSIKKENDIIEIKFILLIKFIYIINFAILE